MKTIFAELYNINDTIFGKISKKKNYILKISKISKINYSIVYIANQKNNISKTQPTIIVENISIFNSGDIIQVEPSGMITFLFEIESDSNLIFVTNKCNCNCIMCPQLQEYVYDDYYIRNKQIISLIDSKTKYLAFTGGEPTLKKNDFLSLLKLCKKMLKNTRIEILTNGILLDDINYVKEIILLNHPHLSFHIPLYSDISKIHNHIVGTDCFFSTINGMYNLAKFKQNIELRVVIHKQNYDRLPQLAEFIYRNLPFVNQIALMGMEYQGNAIKNISDLWIDPYDYKEILTETVILLNQRAMQVSIFNHQLCIIDTQIWNYARKSISSWKNFYLNQCNKCIQKDFCGGFFITSHNHYSKHINPIINLEQIK